MASVKASPSGQDKIQKAIEAKGWNTSNDIDASIEVSCYRLRQSLKHRGWELNRLLEDREIKKLGIFDNKNLDKIFRMPGRSSQNYEDILQNIESQKIAVKGCSPSTWKRFRESKSLINFTSFKVFCEFLELDWEDIKESAHAEKEIVQENSKSRQNTTIGALPALPPSCIPRPNELQSLKAKVLARTNEAVIVTGTTYRVGIRGMGGIGKTVLAKMLAKDLDIQEAFPDGVIFMFLGQNPNLVLRQSDLVKKINGSSLIFKDEQQGKTHLSQLLAGKACLLILDDVWQSKHLDIFNVLDSNSCLLVTTRHKQLVNEIDAVEHEISVLSKSQAISLLALRAGEHQETLPPEAYEVARECGYLPLALAMIGAMVKGKSNRWANVLQKLRNADLEKIKAKFPDYEYPNLFRAIQVSVDDLEPETKARYLDFAVFPEYTSVPEAVLQTLWQPQGLDQYDTQDIIDEIVNRSLIEGDQQGRLKLHDIQYDYVRKQTPNFIGLHNQLLDVYSKHCPNGWHFGKDDGYFFEHLAYHLKQAGRIEELREILHDFDWLQTKVEIKTIETLITDYDKLSSDDNLLLIRDAIRTASYIISDDKNQLASQLIGRLSSFQTRGIQALLNQAQDWKKSVWLCPLTPSLLPADSPLIFCLKGHSKVITDLALTIDEQRLISASEDGTLKIWDLQSGQELKTLNGHTQGVTNVVVTPDGKYAVSSSWDKTLIIWNLESGEVRLRLESHSECVTGVTVTPNGERVISASRDYTRRVWDLESGQLLKVFKVSRLPVPEAIAEVAGQRIELGKYQNLYYEKVFAVTDNQSVVSIPDYSFPFDRHITVWDIESGEELLSLYGHTNPIRSVSFKTYQDGRREIISVDSKNTVKVWDIKSGREVSSCTSTSRLFQERYIVTSDNKMAISKSSNGLIKVWKINELSNKFSQSSTKTGVGKILFLPTEDKVATASRNGMLKIWSLTQRKLLKSYRHHGICLALTPDKRYILSGGFQGILKTLDLENGTERVSCSMEPIPPISLRQGNETIYIPYAGEAKMSIFAVATIPNTNFVIVGLADGHLEIFNFLTGEKYMILSGHNEQISDVKVINRGNLVVSSAFDGIIKLWNWEKKKNLLTIPCHTRPINSIALFPNAQGGISASHDCTLKIWMFSNPSYLETLKGHSNIVWSVAITSDGKYAVSASQDQTLKIWQISTRKIVATFYGESAFLSCSVSLDNKYIIAGEESGQVHFLEVKNLY